MASVASVDAIEVTLELRPNLAGSMMILYDSDCESFMLAGETRLIEEMRLVRSFTRWDRRCGSATCLRAWRA